MAIKNSPDRAIGGIRFPFIREIESREDTQRQGFVTGPAALGVAVASFVQLVGVASTVIYSLVSSCPPKPLPPAVISSTSCGTERRWNEFPVI